MLYPCNCPVEPDGGVSRRATLIRVLKKDHPNALVLDAGGFFAGGVSDENSQNVDIDMRRTDLALKSMEVMGYDAAAVSDDEFNFGVDFLLSRAAGAVPFLSCTVKDPSGRIKPFIIKDVAGTKVAVIGVTPQNARNKAVGLGVSEPGKAVAASVRQAKLAGAQVIILLSQLGESEDRVILADVKGIDAVVSGPVRPDAKPVEKIGDTVYFRSVWEGRKLGLGIMHIENGSVKDFRCDLLRVSAEHADAPEIQAFLPQCFVDSNCRRINPSAVCQNGGTKQSACVVEKGNPVHLTVITSKDCAVCATDDLIRQLKDWFPVLKVTTLQYTDARAKSLFNDVGATGLPVYLLGAEVEKDKRFDSFRENLEKRGNYYMIKPQIAGLAFLTARPYIKGAFDLFVRVTDARTPALLNVTAPLHPNVHFITGTAVPPATGQEVEECLRAVCVKDAYPDRFAKYVSCRVAAAGSSWWEDCAGDMDVASIRECARGERGAALLADNTALTRELRVGASPTYLLDNQQIFGTDKVPTEDDLKSLMKK